jgi:hypothetical protein
MEGRLHAEHELLQRFYPGAVRAGSWFLLPEYRVAADKGWCRTTMPIAFQAQPNHPATAPYGFYVPAGITCNGARPNNYTEPCAPAPPFDGSWGMFSWSISDAGLWIPKTDLVSGANLLSAARSFADRFLEGV